MSKDHYPTLRRISFWFFLLSFFTLTPLIVAYSLGYKFDIHAQKMQKTGAISIKSAPRDVAVYLDGAKVSDNTPFTSRSLLPKSYQVVLQKDNFYPYETPLDVRSAMVSELDVTLIPKLPYTEKLLTNFNVYKFFVVPQLFGKKIIAFTDRGLFEVSENLENPQKLAALPIAENLINTIMGLKENKNYLVFWNPNQVWLVVPAKSREDEGEVQLAWESGEMVKDVFWGIKGKYLIIHDGLKIFAVDVKNTSANFLLFTANSLLASVNYDSDADTLYIKDRLPNVKGFSLFRIAIMDVINEKNPK